MNPINQPTWQTHNPNGRHRILVTKPLPGTRWLEILTHADCRVEICEDRSLLDGAAIAAAMGSDCAGAIGQLTESWDAALFEALAKAGGRAYSNYAVGYNNVDVEAATQAKIPVGNTPGVLTETTAEMAVALTFAAARRLGEAERFLRAGRFTGWLPDLFLGSLLSGKTLGIIGAGRIGAAYARMMVAGHGMSLIYHGRSAKPELESFVADLSRFRESQGQPPVTCRKAAYLEELLAQSDVVSLHTALTEQTRHLIDARALARMKPNAILINTSRGPVLDEAALVAHCQAHPEFRAGLDVFEDEPAMAPGLNRLDNVTIVPHIASATGWTREGMAVLAACNLKGILAGDPVWEGADVRPFLQDDPPAAIPSLVNGAALGL